MAKRSQGTGFHYRDSRSGRFVPKSTWKRSKAQGGKRYKREKRKSKESNFEGVYSVNVEYTTRKKINDTEVQIFAKGPSGQSRAQVIAAVERKMETKKNPKGWKINAIEWKKPSGKTFKDKGEDSTWQSIEFLVTGGAEIKVSKKKMERRRNH